MSDQQKTSSQQKLTVFNNVSLDGFFADANGDMRWAHNTKPDAEWAAFIAGNASSNGALLFGRVTYELMAGYWPTPLAAQQNGAIAERINQGRKIVFSKTLKMAPWNNTKLIKSDLVAEVRALKQESGSGLTILGSGTIVSQLAQAGLIDEFHFVINPIVLGKGRTLFETIKNTVSVKLIKTRAFSNGNVVLCYQPERSASLPSKPAIA